MAISLFTARKVPYARLKTPDALYSATDAAAVHSWNSLGSTANNIISAQAHRAPNGLTMAASGLTNNIQTNTDWLSSIQFATTPAAGTIAFQSFVAWDTNVLAVGAASSAFTLLVWRSINSARIDTLTESGGALTGAVAGDSVARNLKIVRDAYSGVISVYAIANDKLWTSTNDGVAFTAQAASGRVVAPPQECIASAMGYTVIGDSANSTTVSLRVFNLDPAVYTWQTITVGSQTANSQNPLAVTFSESLKRWLVLTKDGTIYASDTTDPTSTWRTLKASPLGTVAHTCGALADTLALLLFQEASGVTIARVSGDLGQSYAGSGLIFSSGTETACFDGRSRFHVVAGGNRFCSDPIALGVSLV